ncbi:MAG: hypothetical protein RJA09_1655 [Pseudomonadota bacterium]
MLVIVLISASPPLRSTTTDGHFLRDRVRSGFGVRLNARKHTFLLVMKAVLERRGAGLVPEDLLCERVSAEHFEAFRAAEGRCLTWTLCCEHRPGAL